MDYPLKKKELSHYYLEMKYLKFDIYVDEKTMKKIRMMENNCSDIKFVKCFNDPNSLIKKIIKDREEFERLSKDVEHEKNIK